MAETTMPVETESSQAERKNQQEAEHEYSKDLFSSALLYGMIAVFAALIICVGGLMMLPDVPQSLPFYAEFSDWKSLEEVDTADVGNPFQEIISSTLVMLQIFTAPLNFHVAGIARVLSLPCITIAAFFTFRRFVLRRYELRERLAQLEDVERGWGIRALGVRLLYTLAAYIGSYVVVSLILAALGTMFKDLELSQVGSVIFICLFVGIITTATTYFALAVSTHELLLLGFGGWGLGLAVSFALAPDLQGLPDTVFSARWWCDAVSSAGIALPTRPIFTASFLCVIAAVSVLWFDIDKITRNVIDDIRTRLPEPPSGLPKFVRQNAYWIVQLLYVFTILGLLGVAFVRVTRGFAVNDFFHVGGVVAAVVCIGLLSFMIPSGLFHPQYQLFSRGVFILIAILAGLYVVSSQITPPPTCKGGFFSLTALELSSLGLLAAWLYITLDNILAYANIHLVKTVNG